MTGPNDDVWTVPLDFPVKPAVRWGHGRPYHREVAALLDRDRARYERLLASFLEHREAFAKIPGPYEESRNPCWQNGWIPPADGIALYSLVAAGPARRYVEVGAGASTRFVRRAIEDQGLETTILSIDPDPRDEIKGICDELISSKLEDADLSLFEELSEGDVVFVDGSHRSFQNSDATVAWLDVLPKLRPGVLFGLHDVFLPADYPPDWLDRFYSEQYLLAAALLADGTQFEIVLPTWFVCHDDSLREVLSTLGEGDSLGGAPLRGSSFWIRKR